jgi:hypothetical protein
MFSDGWADIDHDVRADVDFCTFKLRHGEFNRPPLLSVNIKSWAGHGRPHAEQMSLGVVRCARLSSSRSVGIPNILSLKSKETNRSKLLRLFTGWGQSSGAGVTVISPGSLPHT